jgi:hypothetical protein
MNPHMSQVTVNSAIRDMVCNIRSLTLNSLSYTTTKSYCFKATADSLESFFITVLSAVLMREIGKCLKR